MPDISKRYEAALQKAIAASQRQIRAIYEDAILELCLIAAGVTPKETPFSLSLYPYLNNQVESKIRNMQKSLLRLITGSIKQSWALSNEKNDLFVDKRLKGRPTLPKNKRIIFYDPNEQALTQFLNRKANGLNLSDRVWNLLEPFKHEMEQGLGIEISQGTSASKMATKVKSYLNEPDKLFRRVRGDDGKLHLSKKAKAYKPGAGIYRSSYKNALRLSATENNIAYRSADHERWKKLDFVLGIEVKTSNNHPEFDICDQVKGKYPKDFQFTGWHPQCRCYAVSIQMNEEEYSKYEDYLLGLDKKPEVKHVENVPKGFTKWVADNEERMQGWKSKPLWLKDNKQFVNL